MTRREQSESDHNSTACRRIGRRISSCRTQGNFKVSVRLNSSRRRGRGREARSSCMVAANDGDWCDDHGMGFHAHHQVHSQREGNEKVICFNRPYKKGQSLSSKIHSLGPGTCSSEDDETVLCRVSFNNPSLEGSVITMLKLLGGSENFERNDKEAINSLFSICGARNDWGASPGLLVPVEF